MPLKAIALAALVGPAVADGKVGAFDLEARPGDLNHEVQEVPVADSLKEKAGGLARKAATYLNTHPVIGNPDLPDEYRDILPHEAFGKLKESFQDLLREKLREKDATVKTQL